MSQLSLFPYCGHAPSQGHSETSKAAADDIEPKLGRLRRLVLDTLRCSAQGETDESLMVLTKLAPNTLRPRRRELQLMGLVEDSGTTRAVASGKQAVVWRVVRSNVS